MGLEDFSGVSREQFLGRPKIVAAPALKMFKLSVNAAFEPFMAGNYRAKYGASRACVYDGDLPIAAYIRGSTGWLVVQDDYRRQGIAAELIYQMSIRSGSPPPSITRTAAIQAACENVYDRIAAELHGNQKSETP